ncbi:MAG: PadR family transcriptional regulator [Tissierellaceae bacterium]|nr:PadR family transcriptional regulator [Tissierellaceae bacterium]
MKKNKEGCSRMHNRSGLLEACLLILLKENKSYGYNLMNDLHKFGFEEDSLNISVIYRNLRSMEKRGLITSSWAESDQGPRKRVYEITADGEQDLKNWIWMLKNRKSQIETIIEKYENLK